MIKFNFQINTDKPHWLNKLLPCRHDVARVEENADSRYGTHTIYMMCLKCGRKAMEIERNCRHQENIFGKCFWCLKRIKYENCPHETWSKEPDINDEFCDMCGEWRNEIFRTE